MNPHPDNDRWSYSDVEAVLSTQSRTRLMRTRQRLDSGEDEGMRKVTFGGGISLDHYLARPGPRGATGSCAGKEAAAVMAEYGEDHATRYLMAAEDL